MRRMAMGPPAPYQQGYPEPQPYPPHPSGGVPVIVHASQGIYRRFSRNPMWVEFVPGVRYPLLPGPNRFVLPQGVYAARFFSTYFGIQVGKAELTFDTRAGQPVQMGYAAPYTIYTRGAAGFAPQPRPGIAALVIALFIPVIVVLVIVLITVLTS